MYSRPWADIIGAIVAVLVLLAWFWGIVVHGTNLYARVVVAVGLIACLWFVFGRKDIVP